MRTATPTLCYSFMVRDRSKDRFPGLKAGGLIGIALVGAFFIAIGLHALRAGLSRDRPARPYLNMGVGAVMAASAGAELIRRWRRDRAGGKGP